MSWFNWANAHWPVIVICAGMVAAAAIDWWKFKVPNALTFPLIFSGWLLGLLNNFGWVPGGGDGGIVSALAGTFLAGGLLIPMYAIGGMGAGDVKMSMGFGAWIGAFYGFGTATSSSGMWIILIAFCIGGIAGGIIGLVMILIRGQFRKNAEHVKEIFSDMVTSSGISEVAEKANKRRSRWHRLPYGVPLCIGFVGYLVFLYAAA